MDWKNLVKNNKRPTNVETAMDQGTYEKQTELTKALFAQDVMAAWVHYRFLRTRMRVLN